MTLPSILITFLSASVDLYTFSHWFLCRFLPIISVSKVSLQWIWHLLNIYANEFITNSLISCPRCPLSPGSGYSFCTVLAICAHHFRHPYTLCVKMYNISMIIQSLKNMLLCGFHWHSRYTIWISTFVLLHCMWFTGSSCGQQLPSVVRCHDNWLISSFINSTTHIHAYFCMFFWFCDMWHPPVKWLWLVQSIMAMALMHAFITPWMILCYKWLRCLFYFCSSMEASSPLKVLSFL